MKCHIKGCENEGSEKVCEMHLNKMRRQEPKPETVMDGRGPRGP